MKVFLLKNVNEFIAERGKKCLGRVLKYTTLLEQRGHTLRMPFSKNILPGIFELRVGGIYNIRLIYTFSADSAIIFHGFEKKTQQISQQEINLIKFKFTRLQL